MVKSSFTDVKAEKKTFLNAEPFTYDWLRKLCSEIILHGYPLAVLIELIIANPKSWMIYNYLLIQIAVILFIVTDRPVVKSI